MNRVVWKLSDTRLGWLYAIVAVMPLGAEEFTLHTFERQRLTGTYFSEGANAGDLNRDGQPDVVYGPYWFAGPDFETMHEIYEPVPQDRNRYADHFFSWVYDFNGDQWNDVLVVGFPGTPAHVYENPGQPSDNQHWQKHQVFDWVSNESPQFVNLIGDERPELVCTRDGFFGFVTIDWEQPLQPWTFHPISEQVTAKRFGHGLGIGDVNGDGRSDIIHAKGWYEQPAVKAESSRWKHHAADLSAGYGGAEMHAYDVDGDGDNDIITSDAAHDFGLSWYEQVREGESIDFTRHRIMGSHPSENKYGILFSEPHSVALADIDGDGLKDIITGKTYWSHHRQSPMWDAGAVVYWFKLVRGDEGVDWVPYRADGEAGIGRQISVADLNGDHQPDIVVGGMKGAHILIHQTETVSTAAWLQAQPTLYAGPGRPQVDGATQKRGPKATFQAGQSRVEGGIEGESLEVRTTGGTAKPQNMTSFRADRWSGNSQLWWTGGQPGDSLTVDLPAVSGTVDLELVLTCAGDYGIVQVSLDEQPLGDPIDLYEPKVVTTGVLLFPKQVVQGSRPQLNIQILGANPQSKPAFMFGLDYVRIKDSNGRYVTTRAASPNGR